MFKNYLKIAFRNLFRHKIFSFINIAGLAVGITCSLLILLWVQDELSYNRFHANGDLLYRVMEVIHTPDADDVVVDATPGPLAEALPKVFPEIQSAAKLSWEMQHVFSYKGKAFKENGRYASPEFLKMFTFPLKQGNIEEVLQEPRSVVISEIMARKYFGNTPALGKILKVNNQDSYQVTGILADVPENSTLRFDYIMPIADFENKPGNEGLNKWDSNGARNFVMLRQDANREVLEAKLKGFLKKYLPESGKELFLQPIKDIYLYSDFRPGKENEGQIRYVRLFAAVAAFVLLIACINFMNLSTARSAKRAREVGVRKVIGAGRYDLIRQFMGEAVLISVLAAILSACLTQLSLPAFNALTGKHLLIHYNQPEFYLYLFGIALITGIISGSYPALFLSAFRPAQVLKAPLKNAAAGIFLRKGLVTFQFVLSAVLLISALVIYKQVQYMHDHNIGLDRENVVYVPLEGELKNKVQVFKNELQQAAGVQAVTAADQVPFSLTNSTSDVTWAGKSADKNVFFSILGTDHAFATTMGIHLKEGRYFSKDFKTDTEKIVLNEEAVRQMQVQDPIGMKLSFWGFEVEVIGVVKDFHTTSMQAPLQPLIMIYSPAYSSMVFVRTEPGKTQEALASLQTITHKYNPAYPFEYHFMDSDFEAMYKSEAVTKQLAKYFAGIAILISCLGLFGLALYTAEQRTKEIGIRKILGASVSRIVGMLTREFVLLILVANLLAWPLAWYLMQKWLQDYAFRIELSWWMFAVAGLGTLLLALVTISFQAVKAGLANPVKALRSE